MFFLNFFDIFLREQEIIQDQQFVSYIVSILVSISLILLIFKLREVILNKRKIVHITPYLFALQRKLVDFVFANNTSHLINLFMVNGNNNVETVAVEANIKKYN
jgi:hypothetical protein